MHVLATAGHVDHGKSTLVRALTGTDPDRLAEEKRRGLTIDLGYAWTTLSSGDQLAFVDVPGHERFIGTMLAGLGPAPGVLFVVAADAGWSRQSDDHLAAVDALGLEHGVLAVTRSDLAEPDATVQDSLDRISTSSLGRVETVAVSGTTGRGLDELRAALRRLVTQLPPPDPAAPVRLWIDRAFTMRGSGTVVTGTLAAGTVRVGDQLLLHDRLVAVRALQSLGADREFVSATARVALNLRGIPVSAIGRGDVLLTPQRWHRTDVIDVRLNTGTEPRDGLILHVGTAAIPIRLRPLDDRTARLTLPTALPLRAGDRGVLRDPSRHEVAGGVLILDADPPPLRRRGAAARRAAELRDASARPELATELRRRGAVRAAHLAALGIVADESAAVAGWFVSDEQWQRWRNAAPAIVQTFAQQHPLEPQLPLPALAHALRLPDDALLPEVLAGTELVVRDGRVSADKQPASPAEAVITSVEQRLRANPFDAPDRNDLTKLGLGRRELGAAVRAGRLLVLHGDVVLLPDAPEQAAATLAALDEPFTLSDARIALGTSRRICVPLLEYLDSVGRTERVDDRLRRFVR